MMLENILNSIHESNRVLLKKIFFLFYLNLSVANFYITTLINENISGYDMLTELCQPGHILEICLFLTRFSASICL